MLNGVKNMAKINLKSWAVLIAFSFFNAANDVEHVEPAFNEAAGETDSGGGVKWHAIAPMGLPGPKFHAMTGQMEKSHDVRRARVEAKGARASAMGQPDYYGSFEKINSFKM